MGSILSSLSQLMYMGEKFILYVAGTALICSLIITILVTLGMGVGLGYNYCFVDMKTKYKYVPGRYIYPTKPNEDGVTLSAEDIQKKQAYDEKKKQAEDKTDDSRNVSMRASNEIFMYDNETEIDNQPVSYDSTSFNGTQSLVDVFLDAVTKYDETTKASQNIPESNGSDNNSLSLRFCTIASTTRKTHEMMYDSDEPTPESELQPTIELQPTQRIVKKLVIPISGLDLISLLSKLKVENNNYSLQLVTN